jgi:hypothetical protein
MPSEEQAAARVAAKLTGGFYVGQRVRYSNPFMDDVGTVMHVRGSIVDVILDQHALMRTIDSELGSIEPML